MHAHFPAPQNRPIVLWGAGSQAKVLNQLIEEQCGKVVALFSDTDDAAPFETEVVWGEPDIAGWVGRNPAVNEFAVAIGGGHGGARLAKLAYLSGLGLEPVTLTHETATVLSTKIGRACQLLARSFVGVDAEIGDGVILNTGAAVDHECRIGDGVHIGPGAVLAGRVTVGARSFIGTGARVCPDVHIGPDCVIGAGAVVISDMIEPGTYVGVPARRVS